MVPGDEQNRLFPIPQQTFQRGEVPEGNNISSQYQNISVQVRRQAPAMPEFKVQIAVAYDLHYCLFFFVFRIAQTLSAQFRIRRGIISLIRCSIWQQAVAKSGKVKRRCSRYYPISSNTIYSNILCLQTFFRILTNKEFGNSDIFSMVGTYLSIPLGTP